MATGQFSNIAQATAQRMATEMKGLHQASLPTATAPVVVNEEPAKIGEGQKSVRDMLPGYLGKDFAVTLIDPTTLPPHVAAQIPDVDPFYQPNLKAAAAVLLGWELGDKCLLSGEAAVGKSSLYKHLAALTGRPFIRINGSEDMESTALLGQCVIKNGEVVFSEGPVTEGIQYPSVIVIDEWDQISPGVLFSLQWLLEDDGKLFLRDKPGTNAERTITPHALCRVNVCGNTRGHGDETGSFAGTRPQNAASLDRFKTAEIMGYLPQDQEIDILMKRFPSMEKKVVRDMVKVAGLIRQARKAGELSLPLSMRGLVSWCEKAPIVGVHDSFRSAFLNKLPDAEHNVAEALLSKAFVK